MADHKEAAAKETAEVAEKDQGEWFLDTLNTCFYLFLKINNKEQNDNNCKTSELKICAGFIFSVIARIIN